MVVSGNVTTYYDGGVIHGASVSISGGSISGNEARHGGGLYGCSGQVTNSLLIGNVASGNGGGVWTNQSSLTFTGCSLEESDAGGFGGAMYVSGGTPTVQSGQVRLNSAGQAGGIWVDSGTLRTGNTLYCGNGVNIAGNYQDLGGNTFQGQCDPFCDGDVNGNTWVDAEDLARLLANWGPCDPAEPCYADFNGYGFVNAGDLAQVLGSPSPQARRRSQRGQAAASAGWWTPCPQTIPPPAPARATASIAMRRSISTPRSCARGRPTATNQAGRRCNVGP